MRYIIFFFFLSMFNAFAQITITKSDMENTFALGNSTSNHEDTLITSIDIGSSGGGNVWDFTMLQNHLNGVVTSVDPSTTPYIDEFPGANYVNHTVISNSEYTSDIYFYFL